MVISSRGMEEAEILAKYDVCVMKNSHFCRASLKEENGVRTLLKPHNGHPIDDNMVQEFRSTLLRRAVAERTSFRNIYDEEAARNPDAAMRYTWPSACSTMSSARRRRNPAIPTTLRGCAVHGNNVSLFFGAQHVLDNVVAGVQEVHTDGIFKVVPRVPRAHQLFIIHCIIQNKTIPVAYILMSNRMQESYVVLKQFAPTLEPVTIMTDYERLLKQALMIHFPNARIKPQSVTSEDNTSQPKVVYNISDEALDKDTTEVLTKGFNFAVAPLRIPVEEIVCSVESAIQKLEKDTAETIRQEVSRVLRRAKSPKKNISKEEYTALKKLRDNQNIIVLPADKGNATVVMNSADYKNKMTAILADPVYKPITSDPTTYLEKTTTKKIEAAPLDEEIKKITIPREKSSKCPKIYGLPKSHKPEIPLRPIVSSIGSPIQLLARYLSKQLEPFADQAPSYVKNADHLIEKPHCGTRRLASKL
ncbi:hypothetical protein CBL_07175 [Carabus blaptoides fortunei]